MTKFNSLKEYLATVKQKHPDEECKRNRFAALHYLGEPQFSIVNGKIVFDNCTCSEDSDKLSEKK